MPLTLDDLIRMQRVMTRAEDAAYMASLPDATAKNAANFDSALRALHLEITPAETFMIMQRDGTTARPLIWCPDEDYAREFLDETDASHAFLSVWKVSREEPAPTDITLDFCDRWLADRADYFNDEDGFMSGLPEFVVEHFGDEALNRYRAPKDGE